MDENTKNLVFLIEKSKCKLKLYNIFLDILSEVKDIVDDITEYKNLKREIKSGILFPAFKKIDKSLSFNECINILDNAIDDIYEEVEELYDIEELEIDTEYINNIEEDELLYLNPNDIITEVPDDEGKDNLRN